MKFLLTDCVEAGVDFSFRTAFRESRGLVNLLQIAGAPPLRGLQIGDCRFQIGRPDHGRWKTARETARP